MSEETNKKIQAEYEVLTHQKHQRAPVTEQMTSAIPLPALLEVAKILLLVAALAVIISLAVMK